MSRISQPYKGYISSILNDLGIELSKFSNLNLPLQKEESNLQYIGTDIYNRKQYLLDKTAKKWFSLQNHAKKNGIKLQLISAFRSVEYQRLLWEKKLSSGSSIEQIIFSSVPPGFSEHHTGRSIDITTEYCSPLSYEFELTSAYMWLVANAAEFDLEMTYKRNNKYGINFEPWHWCFQI